jgi:hypothetical protein
MVPIILLESVSPQVIFSGPLMTHIPQDALLIPWTPVLRTLGVRLDAISARNVMILDAGKGLVVRCNTVSYAESHAWTLTYEELGSQDDELIQRRTPVSPGARATSPEIASSGYTDLFRLVGGVLDAQERWLVLLDEQPDGVVLSYMYYDLGRALSPQKGCIVFPQPELAEMRDKALRLRAAPKDESRLLRRLIRH